MTLTRVRWAWAVWGCWLIVVTGCGGKTSDESARRSAPRSMTVAHSNLHAVSEDAADADVPKSSSDASEAKVTMMLEKNAPTDQTSAASETVGTLPPPTGPVASTPSGPGEPQADPAVAQARGTQPDANSNIEPRQGGSGDADRGADDATSADPVLGEQPLFSGWRKPRAVLILTGRQHGYLEPCGCAGLDRQKGGLIRRFSLIRQLRAKGWNVVSIDAGNQVRRFGRQPEIKFQMTVEGLKMMGYQAIALGPDDLRLSAPELFAAISSSAGDGQASAFVSANVEIFDPSCMSAYRVLGVGGKKVGVTAVLGARNQKRVDNQDVVLRPARESLTKVWPKLQTEHCDLNVLIVHGTIDESIALGKQFPGFQIVITTGGAGEPRRQPDFIAGTKSQLVEVGTKGMYAGVIGLFDDPTAPLRYQRVPLDARFPDSPEMLQLLAAYQDQLRVAGLSGLGIRPQPHPSGMKFVGSETCQDCHPKAYKIWKQGLPGQAAPHSHAYQTLLAPPKRANVPRNYDPECISCHVIGWNPQQYYPYESGYLSLEKTPKLINVGCEDCHGPGARHAAAENGDIDVSDEELETLQKAMALPLDRAEQKCLDCHDLDNSPDFQAKGAFQEYWEKIKH